jgi:hypothetical protein
LVYRIQLFTHTTQEIFWFRAETTPLLAADHPQLKPLIFYNGIRGNFVNEAKPEIKQKIKICQVTQQKKFRKSARQFT